MTSLTITKARAELAEVVNRVAYRQERLVLERRGKGVAAIVPIEDLALLEALEDKFDLEKAREAIAEARAKGGKPIPWEIARKELGL